MSNPTPRPRVFADFQNADPSGRVRLNCSGTLRDLADQGVQLREDLEIEVYSEELSTPGEVHYSAEERLWVARIDWDRLMPAQPAGLDLAATLGKPHHAGEQAKVDL